MKWVNRCNLRVEDLFNPNNLKTHYSDYDVIWRQENNQLHRYPELLPHMKYRDMQYSHCNVYGSSMRMFPIDHKGAAMAFYQAFSGCKKMCIDINEEGGRSITVSSRSKYTYEDFEHYRNRCIFELRDYLGIHHHGKGEDSKRLEVQRSKGPRRILKKGSNYMESKND